ncbi:MAG: histidine kinase [Oscillospiraceae bacterium]
MKNNYIVAFLRKFKIRTRIFSVITISVIFASLIMFGMLKRDLINYTEQITRSNIATCEKTVEQNLKLMINYVDIMSINMLQDREIYNVFAEGKDEDKEKYVIPYLEECLKDNKEITGLMVVGNDGQAYQKSLNNIEFEIPDKTILNRVGSKSQYFELKSKDGKDIFTVQIRKYTQFHTAYNIGYLCVFIDKGSINRVYENIVINGGNLKIVDSDMTIISSEEQKEIGRTMSGINGEIGAIPTDDITRITFDDKSYFYSCKPLKLNGAKTLDWYTVFLIPYLSVETFVDFVDMWITIVLVLICLTAIIFSAFLSNSLIKRINMLKNNIDLLTDGDFTVDFNQNTEADEIYFLEQTFDEMVVQIDNLIEKNNCVIRKQKEAEFQILQAQINPHFIYNTLDSVRWIAKLHKQNEIEKIIQSLAIFFRISLHKGDKYIRVSEEIEHVKNYIEIENMRVHQKFEVRYDIDNSILDKKIIKIILQPIVENAIKHGLLPNDKKGLLEIKGFMDCGKIHFVVIDNGIGFDVSKVNDVNTIGGFGIKNVSERIKFEYGNDYEIKYESKIGEYTKVDIYLGYRM